MKNLSFCRLTLATSLLCSFLLSVQAQESSFGNFTNTEEATDGKPIPGNKCINLANTVISGTSKILLTRLNALGAVEMFATIQEGSYHYFGQSIDLDLSATGGHIGYFITGARKLGSGPRQMILIRTDVNGMPTWTKVLPNIDGVVVDEIGVSVERQSNSDVVVVGKSNKSGVFKIVIARFSMTSNGSLVWCYRYHSDQGLSFEPAEACNGLRPSPNPGGSPVSVIAVTGKYTQAGVAGNHTFLFLVNAQSGTEIWRQTYHSGQAQDEGLDVVYKPAANQFDIAQYMIVGGAGLGHPVMWVVRANASTGTGTGARYSAGLYNSAFIARAVNLSLHTSGTRAVVCGILLGLSNPNNAFFSRTFAMELPFSAAAAPTWAHYFNASNPIGNVSESISRIPAILPGTPAGYFITCGGRLAGAAAYDQHAIRTNNVGLLGLADCPTVPFTTTVISGGTTALKGNNKLSVPGWNIATLNKTSRTYIQQRCDGIPLAGEDDIAGRSDEEEAPVPASPDLKLFPNPAGSGQSVSLAIEMTQQAIVVVEVFDVTGKQIWASRGILDSGSQEIALPANDWPAGTYLVRLQSPSLNKTLKLTITH